MLNVEDELKKLNAVATSLEDMSEGAYQLCNFDLAGKFSSMALAVRDATSDIDNSVTEAIHQRAQECNSVGATLLQTALAVSEMKDKEKGDA